MSRALIGGREVRLRLARLRNGGVDYFPLALRAIPSEQNTRLWPSSAPRWLAAEMNQETSMAIIGTFTQNGNGLQGTVKTLALNAKVRFVPGREGQRQELGHRRHHQRRPRRRLKEDLEGGPALHLGQTRHPSFRAPIYASLIEAEDGAHNLIWSR